MSENTSITAAVEAAPGERHSAVIQRGISMAAHQIRAAIAQAVARGQLSEEDGEEVFRALESGEIDMALAGLDKDESRSGRAIYSRSYIDSYMVAIVHSELVKNNAKETPPVVR